MRPMRHLMCPVKNPCWVPRSQKNTICIWAFMFHGHLCNFSWNEIDGDWNAWYAFCIQGQCVRVCACVCPFRILHHCYQSQYILFIVLWPLSTVCVTVCYCCVRISQYYVTHNQIHCISKIELMSTFIISHVCVARTISYLLVFFLFRQEPTHS